MPDGQQIDRLIKLPEVMEMVAMGRSTIYDRVAAGTFPAPLELGPGSVAWIHAEVQAWIRDRPRARTRGKAARATSAAR